MKKVFACITVLFLCVQMVGFAADYTVKVDEKSTSGATVSVSSQLTGPAVGVWADFDEEGKIVKITSGSLAFENGVAEANYVGSFTKLRFMVFEDLLDIKPLCGATDITIGELVLEPGEGIEDLGDFGEV